MSRSKPRQAFRPRLDRLEPLCLLTGGIHAPALVHALSVVDLKPTQVGKDAVAFIASGSPSRGRQEITLGTLTADSTAKTITGRAAVVYKIGIFPSVTANVNFTTSIDKPKASAVKVSLSQFSSLLRSADRAKVAAAVVKFIRRDHDAIVAQFPK